MELDKITYHSGVLGKDILALMQSQNKPHKI